MVGVRARTWLLVEMAGLVPRDGCGRAMARPIVESVWRFSEQLFDSASGRLYIPRREPYRYVDEGDLAIVYVVDQVRFLDLICAEVYRGMVARPQNLWRQVADFQPEPIVDPFLILEPGVRLVLPSRELMLGTILNERVRLEG